MQRIDNPSEFLKSILDAQDINIRMKNVRLNKSKRLQFDGCVKVNDYKILIEFKSEITPAIVGRIEQQFRSTSRNDYLIAIANYITPRAKDLLKEKGLNYLDKAGNIYLKLPDLFIHVEGNKNPTVADKYRKRAFSKSGGRVVFQFLMDPNLVNATQRKIADYSGVSLGTIPKVFEGLRKEKYLVKLTDKKWRIVDYEKLLVKWVETLRTKILPSCVLGSYKPIGRSEMELLKKGNIAGETQWGGEAAASLLTKYLIPEDYTLFTSNKKNFLKTYQLAPDPNGAIQVFEKFWNHSDCTESHVHPVLIYAQLTASEDSRNLEAAERIRNEYIRPDL